MWKRKGERRGVAFLLLSGLLLVAGCRQDMHDNPRYEAYEEGSHRELPEGTVARGALALNPPAPRLDPAKASATPAATPAPGAPATPAVAGAPAAMVSIPTGEDGFPFTVTKAILDRGENRYNISCLPCHGVLGDGNGMIALRGIRRPPSYHDERLRQAPTSYYYDVITNGFGAMSNYADQLTPEDRWKVIAWIRVLQASQRMPKDRMKDQDRNRLAAVSASSGGANTMASNGAPAPPTTTTATEQISRGRSN
ncbi:MAG: c-type cytochrome [Blastocatellia bacterium]